MLALRFYIDRKNGSEHSRMIDTRETDEGKARTQVGKLLKKGETVNSVASIYVPDDDESFELV